MLGRVEDEVTLCRVTAESGTQGYPAGTQTSARGEIAAAGRPAMVAGYRGASRYDRQRRALEVAHGGGSGANPAGERLGVPSPTSGGDRRRHHSCRRRGRGRVHDHGSGTVLLSMRAGPEVPGLNLSGTHAATPSSLGRPQARVRIVSRCLVAQRTAGGAKDV